MFSKTILKVIVCILLPNLLNGQVFHKEAIQSFTDSFFISRQNQFAALGISIVSDTSIIYHAGYGTTDLNAPANNPVSPGETVFGAASVSKLFTATAVMQLVEQGKINLNEDIRKYLPWLKLKNLTKDKTTVLQLLTHTAGIEDGMIGVSYNSDQSPVKMQDFFRNNPPTIVFEPGIQMSYSNRGMALCGLIVEVVSGMPFYEYVEKYIFSPLQMNHSSFRQPLPDSLKEKSLKYLPELEDDFLIPYPSGSLFTTVRDMGNFMIAHLNVGKFHNSKILSGSTIQLMHSSSFTPQSGVPFMCLAFMECNYNGYRVLYHTGARYYNSILILIPEQKLGIYISMNGYGNIRKEYVKSFLEKFLIKKNITSPPVINTPLDQFKGTFRLNAGSRTTIEMLPAMIMQAKVVEKNNQLVLSFVGSAPVILSPFGRDTFKGDDGGFYVFRRSGNEVVDLFRSNVPWDDPMTFSRLSFYENGILHGILLILSAVILISMFLTWSLKIILKRFYFKHEVKLMRVTATLAYTSLSLFILPMIIVLGFIFTGDYASHVKSNLYLLFTLFNISVLLGAANSIILLYLFYYKIDPKSFKFQLSIISFAFIILLCTGWYWNLIGYNF